MSPEKILYCMPLCLPCHVTQCHAMPCHAMPCHALPNIDTRTDNHLFCLEEVPTFGGRQEDERHFLKPRHAQTIFCQRERERERA